MKKLSLVTLVLTLLSLNVAQARVYKNVKVGSYQSKVDLNEYVGRPFFEVMKDVIYPEIDEQAGNRSRGKHLDGIRKGEGVEVILARDVTTYHVKYKADTEDKVERSGRSFGAVGSGRTKRYIADASYKHYLRTLESVLEGSDREVAAFFEAILKVITASDPSGIARLGRESKQVAADFVAIYIAEQYRRLTATKGAYLGRSHRWDDALVQVTLLSAFHSGQDEMQMYYEGTFTDRVYNQNACLYKARGEEERRAVTKKREVRLYDYWQFTVRSECPGRSGVNITRRDFEKLGKALTKELRNSRESLVAELPESSRYRSNVFKAVTEDLLKGSLALESDFLTDVIVDSLMSLRADANEISEKLAN